MAKLESDHGRLLISFQYHGRRCREYLGLKDTRDNHRAAAVMVREIELEMASGKFDYAAHFPSSRNLERLGLRTMEPPTAHETPTLGDFAAKWLDERRAQLSAATDMTTSLSSAGTFFLPLSVRSVSTPLTTVTSRDSSASFGRNRPDTARRSATAESIWS